MIGSTNHLSIGPFAAEPVARTVSDHAGVSPRTPVHPQAPPTEIRAAAAVQVLVGDVLRHVLPLVVGWRGELRNAVVLIHRVIFRSTGQDFISTNFWQDKRAGWGASHAQYTYSLSLNRSQISQRSPTPLSMEVTRPAEPMVVPISSFRALFVHCVCCCILVQLGLELIYLRLQV